MQALADVVHEDPMATRALLGDRQVFPLSLHLSLSLSLSDFV